jgi:DNA repair protein RecO (recombination protein O)
MKTIVTQGIVLARTNFQEADRIVTLLTPDQGKVRAVAKGVRRQKSKLAGGIELFTVGDITYMPGRGELVTLISTRLLTNYGNIVKDINRTMYGYELLKQINKLTEEVIEENIFQLLKTSLAGLDELSISLEVNQLWITMQLLKITGHLPNLVTDTEGDKLAEDTTYVFSFDDMTFAPAPVGQTSSRLIKLLRLSSAAQSPALLAKVQGIDELGAEALSLVHRMAQFYLF